MRSKLCNFRINMPCTRVFIRDIGAYLKIYMFSLFMGGVLLALITDHGQLNEMSFKEDSNV